MSSSVQSNNKCCGRKKGDIIYQKNEKDCNFSILRIPRNEQNKTEPGQVLTVLDDDGKIGWNKESGGDGDVCLNFDENNLSRQLPDGNNISTFQRLTINSNTSNFPFANAPLGTIGEYFDEKSAIRVVNVDGYPHWNFRDLGDIKYQGDKVGTRVLSAGIPEKEFTNGIKEIPDENPPYNEDRGVLSLFFEKDTKVRLYFRYSSQLIFDNLYVESNSGFVTVYSGNNPFASNGYGDSTLNANVSGG